jgi:LPXTG-motif cell wall-anchored protein
MEPLRPRVLSSTVNPSPHLLAATPQHPILKSAKRWLINEWEQVEARFPGTDAESTSQRLKHRTFNALSMGVKESYARAGRKDVVFPPDYFSFSSKKGALYAVHKHRENAETPWMMLLSTGLVAGASLFLIRRRRKVKT